MLIAANVFSVLSVVSTAALMALLALAVLEVVYAKGEHVIDRQLRKLGDQYVQLVALPLCAAIVGGLIATAIPIWVAYPPWAHDTRKTMLAYSLFTIGLILGVLGPFAIRAIEQTDPKNLIIGLRIDRLKDGDWTLDSKADVLKTIYQQRSVIVKEPHRRGIWLWVLLGVAVVSDICWPVLYYVKYGWPPSVIETLVLAAGILCGLLARYWLWPMSWRSRLKDLDSYYAEAHQLSPPTPKISLSPLQSVHHHHHHHNSWMAVGGLLAGAILARICAAPSPRQR